MPKSTSLQRKSFFGLAALIVSILSAVLLGAFFAVSQMNIAPATFGLWNSLTALAYCITVPIALILGTIGYRRLNDSKKLSLIAIGFGGVPFVILFIQFVWSFLK